MRMDSTQSRRLMSEINVVPLVDVVLVLLVIFMITAPLLYRGIDIHLPRSEANTITPTERVILTVSRQKTVYLDQKEVPLRGLQKALEQMKSRSPEMTVYLQGDEKVEYGLVVEVMDIVKRVGIDRLGLVTEPARDQPS